MGFYTCASSEDTSICMLSDDLKEVSFVRKQDLPELQQDRNQKHIQTIQFINKDIPIARRSSFSTRSSYFSAISNEMVHMRTELTQLNNNLIKQNEIIKEFFTLFIDKLSVQDLNVPLETRRSPRRHVSFNKHSNKTLKSTKQALKKA